MGRIPGFDRYIGIDYSGAETPTSSLRSLRVYMADRKTTPVEVKPPPSPRKYWTRRGIAEWLAEQLRQDRLTLVGIDHGFSFPLAYFHEHQLALDWTEFLDDFQRHWPTDKDDVYVDFVRDGACGNAAARLGSRRWRRLTEVRARGAKSVFHFKVQGSVAKSTRRDNLAAPSSATNHWPGPFLAIRSLVYPGWAICRGRGLSSLVEQKFPM